jgi:hypothetical protein
MTFHITREQLYDLVWSESMQNLSKQIGISDVAIAKHCRKLGVPTPERGYWAKLQAGKKVERKPLPPRCLGTFNRVEISGTLTSDLRRRVVGEPGEDAGEVEAIDVLEERFRSRLGKVAAPRGLSNPHPSIAKLLRKDEELRQKYVESPYSWNKPRFDSSFERRRLKFLNGLFLAFAKVGGAPSLRGDDARELSIHMGDAGVSFELDAIGKNARRGGRSEPEAVDRLYLEIGGGSIAGVTTRWEDRPGSPLEEMLTEIIIGLAVAGEHRRRRWLAEHAAWLQKQREEQVRQELRRKAEAEQRERERIAALQKARSDALLSDAVAWRDADTIRAFVAATQAALAGAQPPDKIEAWVQWALAEADRRDPLASGRISTVVTEREAEESTSA